MKHLKVSADLKHAILSQLTDGKSAKGCETDEERFGAMVAYGRAFKLFDKIMEVSE